MISFGACVLQGIIPICGIFCNPCIYLYDSGKTWGCEANSEEKLIREF